MYISMELINAMNFLILRDIMNLKIQIIGIKYFWNYIHIKI
jgi:hypothetical protein